MKLLLPLDGNNVGLILECESLNLFVELLYSRNLKPVVIHFKLVPVTTMFSITENSKLTSSIYYYNENHKIDEEKVSQLE